MSRDEQIFFNPGHKDERRAALDVARAVGGRYLDGPETVGAAAFLDEIDPGFFVSGLVHVNSVGADSASDPPDEREIHDHLPLIWNLMLGPRYDEELARRCARLAFDRLVTSGVGWAMVLTHDVSELVATYDVEHGVREFPPGTSTYTASP